MYNFKELQQANSCIKTTNVQGKDYAEVNQRIKAFRSICPSGCIMTEMISCENGICIFKATVCDEDMRVLGTGTAYEKEGRLFLHQQDFLHRELRDFRSRQSIGYVWLRHRHFHR